MIFKNIARSVWLCAGLAMTFATSAAPISAQDWSFSSGVAQSDAEWLRLTRAAEVRTSANIQSTRTFTPNQFLHVEFDYVSWGGSSISGDGLSVYLFDASIPGAGTGGGTGGALGYCGLAGAYLGIGLDEYGTFTSSWCENQRQDKMPGVDSVTLRGSQARGYAAAGTFPVKTAVLSCKGTGCTTRQQAIDKVGVKRVVVDLIPKPTGTGYTINLSIDGNAIVQGADYPYAAPATMRLGIAGANGMHTSGSNHEIRNLRVDAMGGACATPTQPSVGFGVPAYLADSALILHYPLLNDGDRVQAGWNGTGKWTGRMQAPASYGLDLSGAACQDSDGACATNPGRGAVPMNTVVVYARQDDGQRQEPTDATVFTQFGPVDFDIEAWDDAKNDWIILAEIRDNKFVKRTISFPTIRTAHIQVHVHRAAGGSAPAIVELEALQK